MLPLSVFSVNLLSENLLLLASILVFIAILVTKVGSRLGTPALLLFLLRVMMVRRDGKFLVPHGSMELIPGDHLIIIEGESDD